MEQAGPKKHKDLTKKIDFGKIEWSFKIEPSRELNTWKKAVRKVVIKCIFICIQLELRFITVNGILASTFSTSYNFPTLEKKRQAFDCNA